MSWELQNKSAIMFSSPDVKDKTGLGSVEVLASGQEEEGSPDRPADPEDYADRTLPRFIFFKKILRDI